MKLSIDYSVRCRKEKASEELKTLVYKAVLATLQYEEIEDDCAVSVTFVSNSGIRKLNCEYRGIDRPTDVLSFPIAEDGNLEDAFDGEKFELGDIVISLERAREQAEQFGHPFEREVAFLSVHSTLHLLGYDHELSDEDDEDMRGRQREIMKILGLEVK